MQTNVPETVWPIIIYLDLWPNSKKIGSMARKNNFGQFLAFRLNVCRSVWQP